MSPNCRFDSDGYCQYCKIGGYSLHWTRLEPDTQVVPKDLFESLIEKYGYVDAAIIMEAT